MNRVSMMVPYSPYWSTNAGPKWSKQSKQYGWTDVRRTRLSIENWIKNAGGEWFDDVVYLTIHVEKPSHHFDAINVLDPVANAVSRGIGINDCWFAVESLTWEMKRRSDCPLLRVTAWQEATEHHHYCQSCGRKLVVSSENFYRCRSERRGYQRICKPCQIPKVTKKRVVTV